MKNLVIVFILFSIKAVCQKNAFEFSIGYVGDKNLNINVPFDGAFLPAPIISNRCAFQLSAGYERKINSKASIIINVRNVSRKIDYFYNYNLIDGFIYNVAEVPLGLRLKKELNEQYKILLDLSPGINYVLSNDNITRRIVTNDLTATADRTNKFQFVKSKQLNYFAQVKINLLSKITTNKALIFFIAYQHQFSSLFRYRTYNNQWDFYGIPIKSHYYSFGFSLHFMQL
jgi:hypothetical protein